MTLVQAGDMAPDFTLPAADGSSFTLSACRPRPVVLFFYPKDDTPGCTTENIGFSRALADFTREGAMVAGISKDSLARHCSFIDKHGLSVPLLSDEAGQVCESYGVWQEKTMAGRDYMGIVRTTVLVGADGRILRVWSPVKVDGHVAEVLAEVRAVAS